jgi:hypothetical protein
LVRTNMWRRLRGLPLVADLRVIHENLTEGEGQSTATDWSRDIAKLNEFFKQSREAKVDNGQRTFVLTLNWNLGEPDLIEKFKSEILPLRPHEFRDKARWKRKETRNLKGIELKRKGKPVLLRTALSALGTLRCMKKARNHRDFMEQFRPEELRIAERASLSIEDASRVYRGQKADAEEYLNQLFPGP